MNDRGLYKMRTISRLTGFSPAVLRAWELRHGILAPRRTATGHRLYTEDDLRVLRRVRELLDSGRSIGEVAVAGREALLATSDSISPPPADSAALPMLKRLEQLRQVVVEGAVALDAIAIERALDEAFGLVTAEVVIHEILQKSSEVIGALWAAGHCSVAGEHLASSIFMHRVRRLIDARKSSDDSDPLAVCACLPDEEHELGVLVVAYHLVCHNLRVAYLGANLPLEDLERACQVLHPRAVYLSVSRAPVLLTHLPRLVELARRQVPSTRFFLGGTGVVGQLTDLERVGVRLWRVGSSIQEFSRGIVADLNADVSK